MSDFRKAIGDDDNEPDKPSNQPEPVNLDDLVGADNLPAVPQFEEASFTEISDDTQATASSQTLGDVEEAQLDEPQSKNQATIKQASKRKPILLGVVALGVVAIAFLMLSGGKKEPSGEPTPAATAPAANQPVKPVAPGNETAVEGVEGETAVEGVDETAPQSQGAGRTFSQTRVQGIISPKERAQGEKLLNQAEAWIQDADHPADGKTGKLRNNARQMAALMSEQLPFTVTSQGPKRGQVQLMLNREVGLCILITPVGKKKIPMLRRVKIYVTGISALRDQK